MHFRHVFPSYQPVVGRGNALYIYPVEECRGAGAPEVFRSYAGYLKQRYGQTLYRVAVDAGFSCPHRGKDRREGGCLYCDSRGSRAPYLADAHDLRAQIERGIAFLNARYGARIFGLYFQAYTGTLAPLEELRRLYDSALLCAPFRELVVSTRPDCIDAEKADLLASYKREDFDVWIELGLQSASEHTLRAIRRGHTVAAFTEAYGLLKERRLKVAIHLIFGLPGEGMEEILSTIRFVSALEPDGLKIHNLHVIRDSPLYRQYLAGEISVPCDQRHLEYCVRALELLPPATMIMRLLCDTSRQLLAAPRGFWPKASFYQRLRREMAARRTWQGRLYRRDRFI